MKLEEKLVACPHWRWMPGMRTADAMRVIHDETLFPGRPCAIQEGGWVDTTPPRPLGDALPDITDPATLGCLLALVRQAWSDPRLVAIYCEAAHPGQSEGWAVQTADNRMPVAGEDHPSEAAALVAALEAAP